MKKVFPPLVTMLLAGLLSLADLPSLHAAKTPPRITRDGLFKAIEIGGLTEEDLIGLIKDYGVDFQCAAEDERKLAAAKVSAKVVEALRANYRVVAPVKVSPALSDGKSDPAPEADEIVAGTQPSPAVQAPAVEAGEIVAGGGKPGQAPAVEEEVVAGGPQPKTSPATPAVEEVVVAGGSKPPQAPAVEPEVVAGAPQPKTSPVAPAVEEEVVAGRPNPSQAPAVESEVVAGGPQPKTSPVAPAVEEEIVAGGPKPPQAPAVELETTAVGPKPVVIALAPPPRAPAPEPVTIAAPQDIPAAAAPVVSAPTPSTLPQQIAAAAPAPREFIPATAQRKVFPTVPSGLAPFVKGTHVVKVRVQIDERGAVQAAHVLSMTGEPSETVARIATQSAQKWQFTPAQAGGKAVPSEQVLRFVL